MKIAVIDNYDSFTFNLVHIIKRLGYSQVDVFRNDRVEPEALSPYDKIILSPGPGIPSEAGILLPLIRRYAPQKSILGVCLGHQAIGEAFGAVLYNLPEVYHGVSTFVEIVEYDPIFAGVPVTFEAGRYHSWIVGRENFPDALKITAVDEHGDIMALTHREYDLHGVQFHPESVLTPQGERMIENFLKY